MAGLSTVELYRFATGAGNRRCLQWALSGNCIGWEAGIRRRRLPRKASCAGGSRSEFPTTTFAYQLEHELHSRSDLLDASWLPCQMQLPSSRTSDAHPMRIRVNVPRKVDAAQLNAEIQRISKATNRELCERIGHIALRYRLRSGDRWPPSRPGAKGLRPCPSRD